MIFGPKTTLECYGARFEVRTRVRRGRRMLRTVIRHDDDVVACIQSHYPDGANVERLAHEEHAYVLSQLRAGRLNLRASDPVSDHGVLPRLGRFARECAGYLLDVRWTRAVPVRSKRVTVLAWVFAATSLTGASLSVNTERGLVAVGSLAGRPAARAAAPVPPSSIPALEPSIDSRPLEEVEDGAVEADPAPAAAPGSVVEPVAPATADPAAGSGVVPAPVRPAPTTHGIGAGGAVSVGPELPLRRAEPERRARVEPASYRVVELPRPRRYQPPDSGPRIPDTVPIEPEISAPLASVEPSPTVRVEPPAPAAFEVVEGQLIGLDLVDVAPRAVRRELPSYTHRAKRRGHEGRVELNLLIDERGRIADLRIGETIPGSDLNKAAIEAAWAWRFEPARKAGVAVRVWMPLTVVFSTHAGVRRVFLLE